MKRPRNSHCPEGQEFAPGRHGKLVPLHTPKLGRACKCGPCRTRRLWTPEARAARSVEYRAKVAAGVQFGSHKPKDRAERWLPDHDAALRSMLGTMDAATIAAKLSEQFPWPRTETAVKSRVKVLRLSLLVVRPMSRREVEHALGVSDDTIVAWIAQGLLVGTPWKLGGGQRKANISRAFTRAEVEAFVRTHPELVQVARIRDRGFRALVEGVTRGRRPLTIKEAARLANVEYGTLMYWCKHGKVPSAYQVDGRHWRISATDLPLLRSMPDQRTQAAQSTRVRRADGTYAPSETAPPVIRVLDRSEAQRRLVGEVAS